MKLAALLFVWSFAELNARHYRVESKFYRRLVARSNRAPSTRVTMGANILPCQWLAKLPNSFFRPVRNLSLGPLFGRPF
jgi:hypothetical protein